MSDDYFYIRKDLMNHPKVLLMLDHLIKDPAFQLTGLGPLPDSVAQRAITGALIIVWSTVYQKGEPCQDNPEDAILKGYGPKEIDTLAETPGLFSALKSVDWLIDESESSSESTLRFPRLMRHG